MTEIKLLIEGGNMKPGPSVGQQLGPLGVNIGKVISQVNEETKGFKSMKVPVTLEIDAKKNIKVKVSTPPTLELIKKETGLEKLSEDANNKVYNLAIEQAINVAKTKQESMLVKGFKAAVKTVIGSCVSAGLLVENKEPAVILKRIDKGRYDSEINSQKSEVSPEKLKELEDFLVKYKVKKKKAEEEKKKKEEEEKKKKEEAEEKAKEEKEEEKEGEKEEEGKEKEGKKEDKEAEKKEEKKEEKKQEEKGKEK